MRRFRAPRLPDDAPVRLDEATSHHLLHVCRHGVGDEVVLFDGSGSECMARIVEVEESCALLEASSAPRRAAPSRSVHLVLGLPKNPATDDALRMATEAGVTEVHPVWAARTQGRPGRVDRWARILASAAAQCGRADVPQLHAPTDLGTALDRLDGVPLWVALPGAEPGPPLEEGPRAVCIGPEGGWSPAEVRSILERGGQAIGLGAWVLRTPTAAAIAVARLAR